MPANNQSNIDESIASAAVELVTHTMEEIVNIEKSLLTKEFSIGKFILLREKHKSVKDIINICESLPNIGNYAAWLSIEYEKNIVKFPTKYNQFTKKAYISLLKKKHNYNS